LLTALDSARVVLDMYYQITDKCPILHTAVVLHLWRQMEYFKHKRGDKSRWLDLVQMMVQENWNQQYKDWKPTNGTTTDGTDTQDINNSFLDLCAS
jgi:hypothetical protein